ncbi:MAG TPA: sialidase family protein, partial [Fimbriimonadaceae bacterium]|nr:sialidase family protein [Fimbriimonadaceae bacterium]
MLSLVALMIVQPMTISVVDGGRPDAARFAPRPWMVEGGSVVGQGPGNFLYADATLGDGDWTIRATLSLDKLDGTAASVVFDGADHLGCDGQDGRMFVEGPHFSADEPKFLDAKIVIQSGKPFDLVCTHIGDSLSISVGGSVVYKLDSAPLFRTVALRPHRATMRVTDFKVEGDVRKGLAAPGLQLIDVFVSGQGGYDTYRIPSLTMAPNGDVLAFCEGRKNGLSDSGNIDIVLRRSKDEGKTWLPMQTIWDDEKNTCGNPCVVVDKKTKTVFLLMTHNLGTDGEGQIINGTSKGTREVWITSSKDDGATWSKPKQITSEVKRGDWTWYATGPGAGIQIHRGPHVGRLVIPCDHIERDTKKYYSHVIYSDDDGETWQIGGSTPHDQTNECEVVELRDGWLMLNS